MNILYCNDVSDSDNVEYGNYICNSIDVKFSKHIYSSTKIRFCEDMAFCKNMCGVQRAIFCCGMRNCEEMVFNKPVSPDRYIKIFNDIKPFIRNGFIDLYHPNPYYAMPYKLTKYIQKMPEYDENIFKAIFGDELVDND